LAGVIGTNVPVIAIPGARTTSEFLLVIALAIRAAIDGANVGVVAVIRVLAAFAVINVYTIACECVAGVQCAWISVFAEVLLVDATVLWAATIKGARVAVVAILRREAASATYIAATGEAGIAQGAVGVLFAALGHDGDVLAAVGCA
jgi:hypothetical protein